MSATLKLWLVVGAVIVALAASVWIGSERLASARADLAATSAQVQSLSSSLAALEARAGAVERGINNLNQRSAENERRIGTALRQNPEWAGSPVPEPIIGELCKFASCAPRDPAGQM